jgi:short-chain fatty acids transporter
VSIAFSLINWGLCLIVGAVFARKVAERALQNNIDINYPILAAAGYSGLMTWHGGFSGSAPLKVAESNHFLVEVIGQVPITETILSEMNIVASVLVLMLIPLLLYFLGKRSKPTPITFIKSIQSTHIDTVEGAEKLDNSKILAKSIGIVMVGYALFSTFQTSNQSPLSFIKLNYINFLLFGLGIIFHGTFNKFLSAISEAVQGAVGIIIQFPLYAGIMGIMKYSGLVIVFSNFFIQISNEVTFPIFTFISAAIVNTFVPSGGGQWAVQGPIVCEAAKALNVPVSKSIMAMAYGDQLTNMLQPFWALPLLGITQLKAKDILPYSFVVMIVGGIIFSTILLLF